MYYYKKDFDYSVEDMIKDYITFKKTKDGPETIQIKAYTLFSPSENQHSTQNENITILNNDETHNYKWLPDPITKLDDEFDIDMNYSKVMYSEVPKMIQPYIDRAVDKMDYEGSPIYNEFITKETFNQISDSVYQETINEIRELGDVMSLSTQNIYWGKDRLLRGLIETLLLHEIFGRRRPHHKHHKNKKFY